MILTDKPAAAAPDPWFVQHRPAGQTRLRLFCFPYAGGAAQIYRTWVERLPAGCEVCAAQLPGRGSRLREVPFTSMAEVVDAVAGVIGPYLDKPFALLGHSMGAIIAFELARRLRREGRAMPLQLFASGRRAPQIPSSEEPTYALPDPEFIKELRRLKGTPDEVLEHPELMELLLPLIRADFSVTQTYHYTPEPPLDCPISVFGGTHDRDVSPEQLEPWREQTTSAFSLRLIPGDHFFIHTSRAALLDALSAQLARLLPAAGDFR